MESGSSPIGNLSFSSWIPSQNSAPGGWFFVMLLAASWSPIFYVFGMLELNITLPGLPWTPASHPASPCIITSVTSWLLVVVMVAHCLLPGGQLCEQHSHPKPGPAEDTALRGAMLPATLLHSESGSLLLGTKPPHLLILFSVICPNTANSPRLLNLCPLFAIALLAFWLHCFLTASMCGLRYVPALASGWLKSLSHKHSPLLPVARC